MKVKKLTQYGKATALCAVAIGLTACGGGGGGGGGGSSSGSFPSGIYAFGTVPKLYRSADMQASGWMASPLDGCFSFAFDAQGRLFMASATGVIRRYANPTDVNPVTFGSPGSGTNHFGSVLSDIKVDDQGKIYIADDDNLRIVRIDDMTGKDWITLDLSPYCPPGTAPNKFALTSTGEIYVTIPGASKIVHFDSMTDPSGTAFGSYGTGVNQFILPRGICLDKQGRIYVSTVGVPNGTRLVRIDDMTGTNWTTYGSYGSGEGQFNTPSDVYVDDSNHIYVLDADNFRVVRLNNMNGDGWVAFGQNGSDPGEFQGSLETMRLK